MSSEPAYIRAVITVDPHKAQITRINAQAHHSRFLKASGKSTPQHNSDVRHVHEFFAAVCDNLGGLEQVLVTGGDRVPGRGVAYVGHRCSGSGSGRSSSGHSR